MLMNIGRGGLDGLGDNLKLLQFLNYSGFWKSSIDYIYKDMKADL